MAARNRSSNRPFRKLKYGCSHSHSYRGVPICSRGNSQNSQKQFALVAGGASDVVLVVVVVVILPGNLFELLSVSLVILV